MFQYERGMDAYYREERCFACSSRRQNLFDDKKTIQRLKLNKFSWRMWILLQFGTFLVVFYYFQRKMIEFTRPELYLKLIRNSCGHLWSTKVVLAATVFGSRKFCITSPSQSNKETGMIKKSFPGSRESKGMMGAQNFFYQFANPQISLIFQSAIATPLIFKEQSSVPDPDPHWFAYNTF